MKILFALIITVFSFTFISAQNEQAPILEKDLVYKDWTYKNVKTGKEINLRNFTSGKKLVMVVYYAPWCPNWKHDAPFVQKLYNKYRGDGFDVIAVGEYDPVDTMRSQLDSAKLTFPAVYESENRTDKDKTLHYEYRRSTGDTRKWGSPWYIFLEPATLEKGEVLARRANVVNGELIEAEAEKFVRAKLGLPAEQTKAANAKEFEICDPEKPLTNSLLRSPL